jgi:hypothetical protein
VPILPTEETHGPHTHIYKSSRSTNPLLRLEDKCNSSFLNLAPYTYVRICVYILHTIYVLQLLYFLCKNSTFTHLCKCLYVRVSHETTIVSTSYRKPYVPAHKPQRSMEWQILKWKQITLCSEIILEKPIIPQRQSRYCYVLDYWDHKIHHWTLRNHRYISHSGFWLHILILFCDLHLSLPSVIFTSGCSIHATEDFPFCYLTE